MYLPSSWYHHVQQEAGEEGFNASVNWWFDMEYSSEVWATRKMVERLAKSVGWWDSGSAEEEESTGDETPDA